MAVCIVTPADIAELERLNKLMALAAAGVVRSRNGTLDPRAPRTAEHWQQQAALVRFIDEHPTLISVLTKRARDLEAKTESVIELARECAAWHVREYPMAGGDVINILFRLGLISEKAIGEVMQEAVGAFTADPNARWTGRVD